MRILYVDFRKTVWQYKLDEADKIYFTIVSFTFGCFL